MSKKEKILKYLAEHPDADTKSIEDEFEVGRRYARRIKEIFRQSISGISEKLFKYLESGHTEKEILTKFKISRLQLNEHLKQEFGGKELYITQNNFGEPLYVYLPKPTDPPKAKPRQWKYSEQPDGQPYLIIQLEDEIKGNEIKICPLSDAHIGHVAHMAGKFEEYVDYIKNTPNVFTFINGDLWEFANKLSIGSGVYEQNLMPDEQVNSVRNTLIELKHKILWAIPGNHEERATKSIGVDVLGTMCRTIGIPYYDEPVYVDINWRGTKFTVFAQHGSSGSGTKGGKMNAAGKPRLWQEAIDFIIMGHVHDLIVNKETMVRRDPAGFQLELRKQYVIVLPSFMGYFNTYGSRKGYAPPAWGTVTMSLFADGDYHARS